MCVDAHVPSGAGETLVFPVGYVLVSDGIDVLFGEAEVLYVNDIVLFARRPTNQEVLRFYISINETLGMDVFKSSYLNEHSVIYRSRTSFYVSQITNIFSK